MKLYSRCLIATVVVAAVLVVHGCTALPTYKSRMQDATLDWETEKAALVLELQSSTITKEQYEKERAELEKAYRDELKAASEQFAANAKREAELIGEGAKDALNPWSIGATVIGSIIAGYGATRAAKTHTNTEIDWLDKERDRRRDARGEKLEAVAVTMPEKKK